MDGARIMSVAYVWRLGVGKEFLDLLSLVLIGALCAFGLCIFVIRDLICTRALVDGSLHTYTL